MSLERYQKQSGNFVPTQASNHVSPRTIERAQRAIAQYNLDAVVESHRIQGRAYVNHSTLNAVGMLSESAADHLFMLARRIGENAAETPWAVEEYKAILRSYVTAADHIIQRQVGD